MENINDALKKIHFAPIYAAFREVCGAEFYGDLFSLAAESESIDRLSKITGQRAVRPLEAFFREVLSRRSVEGDPVAEADRELKFIRAILLLAPAGKLSGWTSTRYSRPALRKLLAAVPKVPGPGEGFYRIILTWHLLAAVGKALAGKKKASPNYLWIQEWFMGEQVLRIFQEMGCDWESARRELALILILLRHLPRMLKVRTKNHLRLLEPLFKDSEVRRFLLYHWDRDVLWFSRERLDELLFWLTAAAAVSKAAADWGGEKPPRVRGLVHLRAADTLRQLAAESGYRVKEFRQLLAARPRKRKSSPRKKKENPRR